MSQERSVYGLCALEVTNTPAGKQKAAPFAASLRSELGSALRANTWRGPDGEGECSHCGTSYHTLPFVDSIVNHNNELQIAAENIFTSLENINEVEKSTGRELTDGCLHLYGL